MPQEDALEDTGCLRDLGSCAECTLAMPAEVLMRILPQDFRLSKLNGVAVNATAELQSIVIVEEVASKTQLAVHEDILYILQGQAVKLLALHLAVVVVVVCSACLL